MTRMLPLRLGRPKLPGHGHAPVATVQRMSTMHDVHASNRTWIVETLAGLDDAGWTSWTLCAGWDVEDLTAHLVDWVLDLAGWARPWDPGRVVDIPERFLRD